MKDIKNNQRLLKSLLRPLIYEWGYDEVRRCLAAFEGVSSDSAEQNELESDRKNHSPPRGSGHSRKSTAIDLVARLELPDPKKSLLTTLASQFEAKSFLPTVSDIRYFLEMRGQAAIEIKQRQDAFRKILGTLLSIADDELERFVQNNSHSGPAQLGPLSDAIKETSAAVRSSEPSIALACVDIDQPTPPDQQLDSSDKNPLPP